MMPVPRPNVMVNSHRFKIQCYHESGVVTGLKSTYVRKLFNSRLSVSWRPSSEFLVEL